MSTLRKFWLEALVIRGRDGEGQGGEGGSNDAGGEGGSEGGTSDDGQTKSDESKEGKQDDESEGFKDAGSKQRVLDDLARERKDRKALAQKVAQFEKAQKERDDADKTDLEKASGQVDTLKGQVAKLAQGYLRTTVDSKVSAVAAELGFRDPMDAVMFMRSNDHAGVDIEQDSDDPTKVEIDEDSLKKVLKQTLKARPHWAKEDQGESQPTGSQFRGGTGPRGDKQMDDDALAKAYPMLSKSRGGLV
jgi:hypothetical protein